MIGVTTEEATFEVTDMSDSTTSDIKVYFEEGLPNGSLTSLTVDPVLISIDVTQGSSGGTRIIVTGAGFGVNTLDLGIMRQPAGTTTKTNVCQSVEVIEYGKFYCDTSIMEI